MRILERESQLAALREYAADAARGVGRLVLVEGEAGIGKSTLLEQLEESLPAAWAWGACEGLTTPRPLGPLHDIADQLGGDLLRACRDQAQRDQLFAALLDALRRRDGLQVLVFEDVHWADDATLDLLRHLARRIQRLPVLLLVSFREEECAPPLRLALGELVRQRSVRRVTLPTLSVGAIGLLVDGTGLDATEVQRLTGGNPYFVAELLAAGPSGLARSARDSVLARVGTLGREAREAVEAAALLGTRCDPELLAEVTGAPVSTCGELVEAGLMLLDGRQLRFRHEITRLAVADTVLPFRAVAVHTRALDVLTRRGSADHSRLAFHAEQAGDSAAVVRHAVRAAEEAASLSSHREAVEHYRRALRFTDDTGGGVRRGLATELGLLDRWEEAEALWRDVLDSGPAEPSRERGEDLRMLSRALWRLSRGAESRDVLVAAVSLLEPLGPSVDLARAQGELAASAMMHGDVEGARAGATAALRLAEQLGATDVAADALNTLGCLEVDSGGDWEQPLRRALEIARDGGATVQAGRCYVNLYSSFVDLDRVAEGERTFREGSAYIDEHEVPVYGYCMLASRSEALELLGRWDDVLDLATQHQDASMSPINRMHFDLAPARVAVRRGTPSAEAEVQRFLDLAQGTAEPQWIAPALALRGEWHWLAGRLDDARSDVEAAAAWAAGSRYAGRVALWQRRLGLAVPDPAGLPDPYAMQVRGDFVGASRAWDDLGMPYEATLARLDSGVPELVVQALDTGLRLGAEPAAAICRRWLREAGVRANGSRQATREHPAGLTEREQEVLALLCQQRTNAEIADALVISVKTAGHHVSAVLAKLGAATRREAAEIARRRGLQDREPAPAT